MEIATHEKRMEMCALEAPCPSEGQKILLLTTGDCTKGAVVQVFHGIVHTCICAVVSVRFKHNKTNNNSLLFMSKICI